MEIEKVLEGDKLRITMPSKLNPTLLDEFDREVKSLLESAHELTLDFTKLEYISSSVIRLLIDIHLKLESKGGKLVIYKPNEDIVEVIQMTGLDKTFNIVQ